MWEVDLWTRKPRFWDDVALIFQLELPSLLRRASNQPSDPGIPSSISLVWSGQR